MNPSYMDSAHLIATLGSEAQVVTAAYDLLAARGIRFSCVTILHTVVQDTPVSDALERLRRYFQPQADLHFVPICTEAGDPIADADTAHATRAVARALYHAVWQAKQNGAAVHLSIAGGRKTMALYGMTAAQLLFDEGDHLWHLFSEGEYLLSKRLHPQPGDAARLVEIPVVLWNHFSPAAWVLQQADDLDAALAQVRALQWEEKLTNARAFLRGSLTAGELRVVEPLVRDGLSDVQLAERLNISPRTVEQHLRSSYAKAAAHWQMGQVSRAQLIALLNFYFASQIPENSA